jgi:hypothetical protein
MTWRWDKLLQSQTDLPALLRILNTRMPSLAAEVANADEGTTNAFRFTNTGRDAGDTLSGLMADADDGATIILPPADYNAKTTTRIKRSNLTLVFQPGARLRFSGAGVGLEVLGSQAGNGLNRVRIIGSPEIIGNPAMTIGFRAVWAARGSEFWNIKVREASQRAHSLESCVSILLASPRCSVNDEAMVTKPTSGLYIDQTTSPNDKTTNCLIVLPIYEGLPGAVGLNLQGADQNIILGGTPEALGTGINLSAGAGGNLLIGQFMEGNTVEDITCDGFFNEIIGAYSASAAAGLAHFTANAYANTLRGGFYKSITQDAAGRQNSLDGVRYSGVITDAGRLLQKRNVWFVPAAAYDDDQMRNGLQIHGAVTAW